MYRICMRLMLSMIIMGSALPVQAENWVYLGEYTLNDGSKGYRYIDTDSISKKEGAVLSSYKSKEQYTVAQFHAADPENETPDYNFNSIVTEGMLNCREKTYITAFMTYYDAAGQKVREADFFWDEIGPDEAKILPGSFTDIESGYVCR